MMLSLNLLKLTIGGIKQTGKVGTALALMIAVHHFNLHLLFLRWKSTLIRLNMTLASGWTASSL
jgi:hypothetical protein